MAKGDAARIRARLNHPILHGDGHRVESIPLLVDYLARVGGSDMALPALMADIFAPHRGRLTPPANIDTQRLHELIDRYGYAGLKSVGEEAITSLRLTDRAERETESLDDYAQLEVSWSLSSCLLRTSTSVAKQTIRATAGAFDPRMPARLKAVLGSDVGHWDVTDFTEVLPEVWEMVEDGLIEAKDCKDLTYSNAFELHTRMNPDFIKGTVIEAAASVLRA